MQRTALFSEVESPPSPPAARDWRRPALTVVLLLAAAIRLVALPTAPPGLNQDEASNAWNAWCLLQTGRDQAGAPWPIFWTHALGENRSTLYLYTLLPFQAIGGLNVWTTRLPAAVAGILTVALIYWITARLFDRTTGVIAAALAALAPWYVDLSRWGHEASLGPLLTAASFAALLWAGLLETDRDRDQQAGPDKLAQTAVLGPKWWRAALAGLICGAACYGYPAVRLYLPLLVATALIVGGTGSTRRLLKSRAGRVAAAMFCLGFALTFGPLLFQHIAHPEIIGRRAGSVWLWEPADPAITKLTKIASRYAAHFGPTTLVFTGLEDEQRGPLGFGAFFASNLDPIRGSGAKYIRSIKKLIDPDDIMNPGKLTGTTLRYGIKIPPALFQLGMGAMGIIKKAIATEGEVAEAQEAYAQERANLERDGRHKSH